MKLTDVLVSISKMLPMNGHPAGCGIVEVISRRREGRAKEGDGEVG